MGQNAQEEGFVEVTLRSTDSYWLPLDQYDALVSAWQAGKTFWSGPGFYGGTVSFKLAEVCVVASCTPEVIALKTEDQKRRELTT